MEEFRDIPGYEGLYQVSNLGRVKSFKRKNEKILSDKPQSNGYVAIALTKDKVVTMTLAHRLVMLTFNQDKNLDNQEVNHINGIKTDNRLENLEWCTHAENMQHAWKTGLKNEKGENHYNTKFNQRIINIIRYANKKKYFNQRELAKLFNVDYSTINKIVLNKSWSNT
jgi:hypothetical protein